MKVSANLNMTISNYKDILRRDGMVEREQLLVMLKADEMLIGKDLEIIADKILDAGLMKRTATNERRMKLYKQGLTNVEMAEKEEVTVNSINYWLRTRGLELNKKSLRQQAIEK